MKIVESTIISKQEEIDLLKKWMGAKDAVFKLVYRASRDGFGASAFHQKVANIKQTLIVVKSKDLNMVFGGYNPLQWNTSKSGFFADTTKKAFLFSLTHKTCHFVYRNHEQAFRYAPGFGPCFGGGIDLCLYTDCNQSTSNYSYLGHTYDPPVGMTTGTPQAKSYLAGSETFSVADYEAFALEFK